MTQASYLAREILKDLITIERTLWENDAEVYHDRYSPEAVLIFPGVGRIDRDTAVAGWNYESSASKTLCASVYVRVGGSWRVAFHQQTPI